MEWQDIGGSDAVSEDSPLAATVAGRKVAVYRLAGQYYALEDVCPHADALLSEGFIYGEEIECALHGARFHIPSGKCTREPGGRDLACFEVKCEGDRVLIRVK